MRKRSFEREIGRESNPLKYKCAVKDFSNKNFDQHAADVLINDLKVDIMFGPYSSGLTTPAVRTGGFRPKSLCNCIMNCSEASMLCLLCASSR